MSLVLIDRGALNLALRALRRDAENGQAIRGEIADAVEEACIGIGGSYADLAGVTKMLKYSYSTDEERYQGHFDSPEDAAAEAFYEDPDLESVFVGEIKEPAVRNFVSANQIFDDIEQRAFDECGECCEDWLDDLRHSAPLLAELEDLVGAWIEKHAPPQFWIAVNVREITRAEMVAAGQLDSERGG